MQFPLIAPDQCGKHSDCGHTACIVRYQGQAPICMQIPGRGTDACKDDGECNLLAATGGGSSGTVSASATPSVQLSVTAARTVSLLTQHGPEVGEPTAQVTIEIFHDMRCSMCQYAAQNILPALIESYVKIGRARLVFREYPLGFRDDAVFLAEAAQCAGERGKYLQFVDFVYQDGHDALARNATKYAKQTGIDDPKFRSCVESRKYKQKVSEDYAEAKRRGVPGTPGFFINGQPLFGAKPIKEFEKIIEKQPS